MTDNKPKRDIVADLLNLITTAGTWFMGIGVLYIIVGITFFGDTKREECITQDGKRHCRVVSETCVTQAQRTYWTKCWK
jgi:hypothetical protein|tara:strand:- start:130 stop:366 length:237 start_codon:yes stop_codon:yes gene_type:complete